MWEVHTKEEMDAMYKETEALLQNFVDSVNKKLTEMQSKYLDFFSSDNIELGKPVCMVGGLKF